MANNKNKQIWIKNIVFMVLVLIVLLFATNIFLKLVTKHNHELIVPDFTNISVNEAKSLAKKSHFRLEVTDSVYIKRMAPGHISRQNPEAGSYVKKGRRILLTINSVKPKMIEMPDLVGYSLRQAKTELLSYGLAVGRLIYEDDIATNNVLAQKIGDKIIDPGTLIVTDTPINLVLGMNKGDTLTFVPNVLGYNLSLAKDIPQDNSFNIKNITFDETVSTYSDSLRAVVFTQTPEYSDSLQYRLGTEVELFLTLDHNKLIKEEETEGEE